MTTTTTPEPKAAGRDAVVAGAKLFLPLGQVVELRALDATMAAGGRPVVWSGFFDSAEHLAEAACGLRSARGVYYTPNPLKPELLARSPNRLQVARAGQLAHDEDVVARIRLLVDVDAVRPAADSSSTDAEHDAAIALAEYIHEDLQNDGWPAGAVVDSGNGGQLLFAIDLPADDGGLVAAVLAALGRRFSTAAARVDTAVFNPARIWKMSGTWARKGPDTTERPHRMARVLSAPAEWDVVARAQLDALLARPASPTVSAGNLGGIFDATTVQMKADGGPVAPGGRNNALASLVGQWVHDEPVYYRLLGRAFEWNASNPKPLPIDEVERTVKSVCRTHVRHNPAASVAVIDAPAAVQPEGAVATPVAASTPQQPPRFPQHLLNVPGFVGEICSWVNATAYKPQPVLTLANVLAFFGAVVGRKVRTASNLRTNLYCLGVGDSGSGKDHSRRCVKAICEAVGVTADLLGGEEVSSDTAITAALFEHPSLLFQFDEIGHLLAQASSKYAQSHQRNIAPTFTKLFSSAGTTYLGKAMASKKRQDIDQPNCCLYGTTVPGRLYDGMTPAEITDGFLGRMLVFKSDDPDPVERDVTHVAVPEPIVKMVGEWILRKLPTASAAGNLMAVRPVPILVQFDDEAAAELKRFAGRCREMKAAHRADRRGLDALWARGVEHASKVALTVACGVDYQLPVVTGDVAKWAVALVDHLTTDLVEVVHESVAGSDFERDQLYVFRKIKDAGPDGVTQGSLYLSTRRLAPRARVEILNQLVLSAMVSKEERKPARGPTATVYVAQNNSSRKQ